MADNSSSPRRAHPARPAIRTFPRHQLTAQIDAGRLGPLPLRRRRDHLHRALPHLVAGRLDRRERGRAGGGIFDIVVAHDAELPRHPDMPPLAFEQRAKRHVVIVAEHSIGIRRHRKELAEHPAAKRNRGRLRRGQDQSVIEQVRLGQRVNIPLQPLLAAGVHPRTDKADAAIALIDQMPGGGIGGLAMVEADHHVHRVGADIHDLHHGAAKAGQNGPRHRGLIDSRHDQPGRALRGEDLQQLLLLAVAVAGIGDLHLIGRFLGGIVDPAQHVHEDEVRDRGNQHPDGRAGGRDQRPRRLVRGIAKGLNRLGNPGAHLGGHPVGRAQGARGCHNANIGEGGNILQRYRPVIAIDFLHLTPMPCGSRDASS